MTHFTWVRTSLQDAHRMASYAGEKMLTWFLRTGFLSLIFRSVSDFALFSMTSKEICPMSSAKIARRFEANLCQQRFATYPKTPRSKTFCHKLSVNFRHKPNSFASLLLINRFLYLRRMCPGQERKWRRELPVNTCKYIAEFHTPGSHCI